MKSYLFPAAKSNPLRIPAGNALLGGRSRSWWREARFNGRMTHGRNSLRIYKAVQRAKIEERQLCPAFLCEMADLPPELR